MAQDMVKEIYDILNFHLGDKDNRGNVRLPDKYDPLQSDLVKFVARMFDMGQVQGMEIVSARLIEYDSLVKSKIKNFKHSVAGYESKEGKGADGFKKRQEALDDLNSVVLQVDFTKQ